MLHIPELEPDEEDLQDLQEYKYEKLQWLREEKLKDLINTKFEVKIIDYGLSRTIAPGSVAETPCGTRELVAPELIGGTGYDFRVDVWNVGIIFYMLITCAVPFQTEVARDNGVWSLPLNLDVSIETLRFLNETIQYNPKFRPFPDQLMAHPYFDVDLSQANPVRLKLHEMVQGKMMCLDSEIITGEHEHLSKND